MTPLTAGAAILGALFIGVVSPGPSFVVVARNAVSFSLRDGLATALGMGMGGIIFSCIALVGLYSLLASVEWLYIALKVAGGLYLVYLAFKIWHGASSPLAIGAADVTSHRHTGASFRIGLMTQLSNPKTAIVYGSIFAALLPQHPPTWFYLVLPPLVFAVETGWYSIVAAGFSRKKPRALYLRAKKWIDRISGAVIAALGLRLVFTASHSGL